MSYKFEAEPKVVQSRAKYRPNASSANANVDEDGVPLILMDPKVKFMQPSHQEEEFVKAEKERIKVDNMRTKLLAFKNSKKKVSPYDIKPSANPRIPFNPTFFLTDSTNVKPDQTAIDCQTDTFQERPKSPQYVPKKTGRDAFTQVEDNELFDFDREVTPICDVMTSKLIEQAVIEIEEEDEIERIKTFKQEFIKRRQNDEKKWRELLQKEIDTIAKKNKILEQFRAKEQKKQDLVQKCQTYLIAKNYLRDLNFNTINFLYNNGFYQNTAQETLVQEVPKFFENSMVSRLGERSDLRAQVESAFTHIAQELVGMRKEADRKFHKKAAKRGKRRINFSNDQRLVRISYIDPYSPASFFARFKSKMSEPNLDKYFSEYRLKLGELRDKFDNGDIGGDDYRKNLQEEFPELASASHFRMLINDFSMFGFSLAHDMYYPTVPKTGLLKISAHVFDREYNYLYTIDENNRANVTNTIKYRGDIRDPKLPISDDCALTVNIKKIESHIGHIFLTLEVDNIDATQALAEEMKYCRARISEYTINQTLESQMPFTLHKFDEYKDASADPEQPQRLRIFSYYLHKLPEYGWFVENLNLPKIFVGDSIASLPQSIENFLKTCSSEETKDFGGLEANVRSSIDSENRSDATGAGFRFTSRSFGPFEFDTSETLEAILEKVNNEVKNEAPLLINHFEYGYSIFLGEKEIVRPTQIRKIDEIKDCFLVGKPKPPEEVKEIGGEEQEAEEEED